jgi:radical SAM family RiPP maturation amino acid epimerase
MSNDLFVASAPPSVIPFDKGAGRAAGVYRELDTAFTDEEHHLLSHVKRFMELILGDPDFRTMLKEDRAAEAVAAHGLDVDPKQLLPLYDSRYIQQTIEGKLDDWPLVRLWKHRINELLRSRAVMRDDGNTAEASPQFDQWRKRQMLRNDSELGQLNNDSIVYPVIAYELSKGCTMGCWFCGISAERFQGYFSYTDEHAALWRGILIAAQRVLGPGTSTGFCYWATDPMDNPHYPRFIEEHHRVTGAMPQTTTAAPMRNVAITREVLELQRAHRTVINRFSITSIKTLRAVHAEFQPEEMLDVELVMQHKEAITAKALAGHALMQYDKLKKEGRESKLPHLGDAYGTIACVAGFLVNMVDRSVMLVSPCRASARYPKGYKVYATANFETADDFERECNRIISEQMGWNVEGKQRLAFRSDLAYSELPDGLRIENEHGATTVAGQPFVRELGLLIHEGTHTSNEVQDDLLQRGADFFTINQAVQDLFDSGMLAEPVDFAESAEEAETVHA